MGIYFAEQEGKKQFHSMLKEAIFFCYLVKYTEISIPLSHIPAQASILPLFICLVQVKFEAVKSCNSQTRTQPICLMDCSELLIHYNNHIIFRGLMRRSKLRFLRSLPFFCASSQRLAISTRLVWARLNEN